MQNVGLLPAITKPNVYTADGDLVYDFGQQEFLQSKVPDSVNPLLWRQGQLTSIHGLFQVTSGIYQVRGFDLANITFIEGKSGWIVVDPLTGKETAKKARDLVDRELGKRPISAVVVTHSHADHYGGVRAFLNEEDLEGEAELIAPDGFVMESVSENVLAGNAMARRVTYMFGGFLPQNMKGNVGVGLGQGLGKGTVGLLAPTIEIKKTGEVIEVDGVSMEFIMALGAEAPSEFMFYLPQFKAFCQAEIINHTLHNMLTPRGAKVRDGRVWSKYIDEAIYLYADKTDVSFGSHHWPTWGSEKVTEFWQGQRDIYRYIHDQTLWLSNQGATIQEIPDLLELPEGIASGFANRGYYGGVGFNARSQYQLYYGFFDGNPANINPLSVVDESLKYIEYMGGAEAVLNKAQSDYQQGEFRFVATILNHLVFAEPNNTAAKELLADTYSQLAYMAESGSQRNIYLTGAMELRNGVADLPSPILGSEDTIKSIPLEMFFDLLAVRLNAKKAAGKSWSINFVLSDTDQRANLFLSNSTLHHRMGMLDKNADATLNITREALNRLNLKEAGFASLVAQGDASIDGNPITLARFFGLIDEPPFWFNIVTP